MSVESALYSMLKLNTGVFNLVKARIYPLRAPSKPTAPYVVYSRNAGPVDYALDGATDYRAARFWLDAWATTLEAAINVREAIEAVISGYSGTSDGLNIMGIFIEEISDEFQDEPAPDRLYRSHLEIVIHYTEA